LIAAADRLSPAAAPPLRQLFAVAPAFDFAFSAPAATFAAAMLEAAAI